MYKKNLVKTAMLASIISISMSGCGGCGKEEVVSALDTAQEVVASVEDKTVEDNPEVPEVKTPIDKKWNGDYSEDIETAKKEADISELKEDTTPVGRVAPEKSVDTMTDAEVWAYLDNTAPEQWDIDVVCKAIIASDNLEWIPEAFDNTIEANSEEDMKLAAAMDVNIANMLANYHDPEGVAMYEQIMAEQNGEYDGPHPTGPKASYHPTTSVELVGTNSTGNIS